MNLTIEQVLNNSDYDWKKRDDKYILYFGERVLYVVEEEDGSIVVRSNSQSHPMYLNSINEFSLWLDI